MFQVIGADAQDFRHEHPCFLQIEDELKWSQRALASLNWINEPPRASPFRNVGLQDFVSWHGVVLYLSTLGLRAREAGQDFRRGSLRVR